MTRRKIALAAVLFLVAQAVFSQASALRDYVGVIDGTYHPDALAYFDKLKENLKKRGKNVKAIDDYIKMGFGTGFVYVAPDGVNYVITNYHVVAQTTTLSISFEKMDGGKTTYDRLRVVAADEDLDIAILTFADGAKPFRSGLSFVRAPVDEGVDVFAAGFPGLGTAQIWQFSKGIVSNGNVRFPRDPVEDADVPVVRFGPFIQHTSPIDPGNSGGPLLVQQAGVTSGYAVAGINSMGVRRRSATFYAIPADRALAYITEAVKPQSDAVKRQNLDTRLDAFIKGLAKPKAVYAAIADYISNACAASNGEYAIEETSSRAPRTVQDAIVDNANDPIEIMQYCVAWLVEDSFRGKTTGTLRATLGDITQNTDGSFTVPLKFTGDRVVNTTWVLEYGIWKLDKAGDLVTGDKTLMAKKEKEQNAAKAKSAYDSFFMLSVGYTQIFDHKIGEIRSSGDDIEAVTESAPAFDIALLFAQNRYGLYRLDLVLAENFLQFEVDVGFKVPIDIKAVTIAPYATAGIGFVGYDGPKVDRHFGESEFLVNISVPLQVGLMVSTTKVPGLYLLANYQYNLSFTNLLNKSKELGDLQMFKINLGYAFKR